MQAPTQNQKNEKQNNIFVNLWAGWLGMINEARFMFGIQ